MYIHTYIHSYICICIHINTYVHKHTYVNTEYEYTLCTAAYFIYTNIYVYLCKYAITYIYTPHIVYSYTVNAREHNLHSTYL